MTERDTQPVGSVLDVAGDFRLRRTGELTRDLTLFVALLRETGIPVPTGSALTAVRALAALPLQSSQDVHAALRSCLSASLEEAQLFDRVFWMFWSSEPPTPVETGDEASTDPDAGREKSEAGGSQLEFAGPGRGPAEQSARRARYSESGRRETLVAGLSVGEAEIAALARRLVRALARSRSRRLRSGEVGELIDIRESLRQNLRFGEELLELRHLRELADRARVVVLCDVSSSMQPFAPLFLTFTHALTRAAASIEAAIFNVELCSVTDVFRRRPLPDALAWLTERSVALAGGTKTGHCLHDFNRQIASRGLTGPNTAAVVLSDGWDVGEPELLDEQARRLHAQVGRVIWLDPHAAASGYRPQVRGLKIALRHVDDYLDFSSPESLRELIGRVETRTGKAARPS